MAEIGSEASPLRVAVIGSGPTGFFTAQHLFKQKDVVVEVDLYDRLPTPFGLVRFGVAPDHMNIKKVTVGYHKVAQNPRFSFFGNVDVGTHITIEEMRQHYHQIVYCTGAQTDRRLGIPGEDLANSCTATEFVAWYNGHPDYRDHEFNLEAETVVVVGVGNVAIDVARILVRTPEELKATDIAEHAMEALAKSKVQRVIMLGRRGPAQAAFTNPEVKELGEMEGASVFIRPEDAEPDEISLKELEANPDRATQKKLEIMKEFASRGEPEGRVLEIRFLTSPTELVDDGNGAVGAVKVVRNELVEKGGRVSPRPTDRTEEIPAQLVLRSVGYRGVPLPQVPFRDDWGTIPHQAGRVLGEGASVVGEYAAGWIKRGPSGVIGTNKPCTKETVDSMLEDLKQGRVLQPKNPDRSSVEQLLGSRTRVVSYADWERLDAIELQRGAELGRPRLKLTRVQEMLEALETVTS